MAATTARRLTNSEVASILGLHHSFVSRMRAGERNASPSTLVAISENFGVPLGDLTRAASEVAYGRPEEWIRLLESAFVRREP